MSSEIHPTAIIGESAILGRNLQIGPYAIIENGAVLGDGCNIESHSVIKASTTLKDNVRVGHFSVVGGDPQHLSFDPQISSKVIIGANSRLGEGVTVHRSMYKDGKTEIGPNSPTERESITYVLEKAFPYAVDAIPLQYGSTQILKVTAQFKYQRHYTIDKSINLRYKSNDLGTGNTLVNGTILSD